MRRVICNQKGGVGKTSIVVNLAAIHADRGIRTLVVDLDPQGNASQYLLGHNSPPPQTTLVDFFQQFLSFTLLLRDPQEFVVPTPFENLFLLASSPGLTELRSRLEAKHKIYKLRDALEKLSIEFGAIYLDTPPAFNFFTLSALVGSTSCLVPFDCDAFSRRGLYALLENVNELRCDHNRDLDMDGIIVNGYQERANQPRRVVEELVGEGLPVLQSRLSASVKMRESHEASRPLIGLAPRHKLTREFIALFDEINA